MKWNFNVLSDPYWLLGSPGLCSPYHLCKSPKAPARPTRHLIHLALPRTTAQLFRWSVSYLEIYRLNPCCTTRQQLQHDSRKSSVGGTYKMVLPSYFCWWPQGTIDLLTIKPGYCSYDMLQYVTIQFCCPLGGPPCKDGPWYYIPWAKPNPLGQHFCGMGVPLPRQQLLGGPVTIETAKYKPSWICWRKPTPKRKKPYRFASRTGSPIEQKKVIDKPQSKALKLDGLKLRYASQVSGSL